MINHYKIINTTTNNDNHYKIINTTTNNDNHL